jgi:hypothetical protein
VKPNFKQEATKENGGKKESPGTAALFSLSFLGPAPVQFPCPRQPIKLN